MSVNYVNFLRREFYEISGASALLLYPLFILLARRIVYPREGNSFSSQG